MAALERQILDGILNSSRAAAARAAAEEEVNNIAKETTLERAEFSLQLSMFVTAEKEREMLIIFFLSSFCQLLSTRF